MQCHTEMAILRDGTLLGHLFEALVPLSVRVFAQAAGAQVLHSPSLPSNSRLEKALTFEFTR